MCSISEYLLDESTSEVVPKEEKRVDTVCRKCSTEEATIVLQRKFSYCKSCFLQIVTHKFRSTIGKLKLKQMKDRILLLFTGSQSSIALLHLLQSGMNDDNHKKLKFETDILIIDDCILWPDKYDPPSTMSEMLEVLKQFPFKRYIVKLSSIYRRPMVNEFEGFVTCDESDFKLKRLFDGMKSSTSKMDLLFQLRSRLLYECATLLNCNKIFTSECATDVAIQLLSDTTLGRYSHITYDTAICDTRNPNIHRIRPLREILSKEITFYLVYNKLGLLVVPSFAAMVNYVPSLQWETSLFISNLQEEFPSTVYTVFNMGDKLKKIDGAGKPFCSLCRMPISTVPEIRSKINADKVSISGLSLEDNDAVGDKVRFQFCYGCQSIVDEVDCFDNLPISCDMNINET